MFFDKFKILCEEKGISCKQAALEIGLSHSIATKWKKTGATPKGNTLDLVAKYFNVPIDFLLGSPPFDFWEEINDNLYGFFSYVHISGDVLKLIWGIDKDNPDNSKTSDIISFLSACIKSLNVDDDGNLIIEYTESYKGLAVKGIKKDTVDYDSISNILPIPKTKLVPLVGTIACGTPILAEENIEDYLKADENLPADFALRCKGDSMINSRIYDGDIVYIRKQSDVDDGEIAAVLIGEEATLKKVYKYPNKVVLRASNPIYDDMVYTNEELENVMILGKAVAFLSLVR